MKRSDHKVGLIVATKDRPAELRRLFKSLETQSYRLDEVIIVDGGTQLVENIVQEFPGLSIKYLRYLPPSAARQRNIGIKTISEELTLIGFLDDDTVLENNALEAMMNFWEKAPEDIAGAAFNMVNNPDRSASWLKSLSLVRKLGLYSRNRGEVLPSGFHTMIGYVPKTTFVCWLPSCAAIWRRKILELFKFDEWYSGYSYLEDLDFSYQVGKKYRLAVVADARYYHYPSSSGRESDYLFGKREVTNRIYFVRKNQELSLFRCYLGLVIRIFISLSLAFKERRMDYVQRIWGNCVGLGRTMFREEFKI